MYKAIVFDLDGTLVDSPLCYKSIREELAIPPEEYILEYLDSLPKAQKEAKQRRLAELELQAAREARPFPGTIKVLRELRELKIHIGILTRNCRLATEHVIESSGMVIDMVVTREDAPPKPDPAGLQKFLHHWKVANHDLLFIGDFRFDIECGKRAGVRTALFTNGQQPSENWDPDYVIHHFHEFWERF